MKNGTLELQITNKINLKYQKASYNRTLFDMQGTSGRRHLDCFHETNTMPFDRGITPIFDPKKCVGSYTECSELDIHWESCNLWFCCPPVSRL